MATARKDPRVSEFMKGRPTWQRTIFKTVRELVLEAHPDIEETIKFGGPYYLYHGMLCYFNPRKEDFILGMSYGASLPNANGILTGEGSIVRHVVIGPADSIPEDGIRQIILEGMQHNEMRMMMKMKGK